jgi:hypothetical protein
MFVLWYICSLNARQTCLLCKSSAADPAYLLSVIQLLIMFCRDAHCNTCRKSSPRHKDRCKDLAVTGCWELSLNNGQNVIHQVTADALVRIVLLLSTWGENGHTVSRAHGPATRDPKNRAMTRCSPHMWIGHSYIWWIVLYSGEIAICSHHRFRSWAPALLLTRSLSMSQLPSPIVWMATMVYEECSCRVYLNLANVPYGRDIPL